MQFIYNIFAPLFQHSKIKLILNKFVLKFDMGGSMSKRFEENLLEHLGMTREEVLIEMGKTSSDAFDLYLKYRCIAQDKLEFERLLSSLIMLFNNKRNFKETWEFLKRLEDFVSSNRPRPRCGRRRK